MTGEAARLLHALEAGEEVDLSALMPIVYAQLRGIAQHQMGGERREHTLQATALVHEAYLRLVGDGRLSWKSKGHFYAAAAEAMRRILVDHARARATNKRGGGRPRVAMSLAELVTEADPAEFLAAAEAVSRLK